MGRTPYLPRGHALGQDRIPTAEVLRGESGYGPASPDFTQEPGFSPLAYFLKAAQRPGTYEREIATRILIVGGAVVVAIIVTYSLSRAHSREREPKTA